VVSGVLLGCSKEEKTTQETVTEAVEETSADPAKGLGDALSGAADAATKAMDQVKAKLSEADALDGKTDKIIARCATCKLSMDGSDKHKLEVAGYTMYFCKASCMEEFAKDTTEAVLAMEIPKE
jgi:YHS domain-containing protein